MVGKYQQLVTHVAGTIDHRIEVRHQPQLKILFYSNYKFLQSVLDPLFVVLTGILPLFPSIFLERMAIKEFRECLLMRQEI